MHNESKKVPRTTDIIFQKNTAYKYEQGYPSHHYSNRPSPVLISMSLLSSSRCSSITGNSLIKPTTKYIVRKRFNSITMSQNQKNFGAQPRQGIQNT